MLKLRIREMFVKCNELDNNSAENSHEDLLYCLIIVLFRVRVLSKYFVIMEKLQHSNITF